MTIRNILMRIVLPLSIIGAIIVFANTPYFTKLVTATFGVNQTLDVTSSTLQNGLVAHYTFDGPDVDWSSTTAEIKDRSNSNHGNAVSMSAAASPVMGVVGQGMDFDGSADYINVGDVLAGVGTVAMWVKPDFGYADGCTGGEVFASEPAGNGRTLSLQYIGCSSYSYWDAVYQGSFGTILNATSTEYTSSADLQQWTHLLMTWDYNSGVHVYVNGVLEGSDTNTSGDWAATNESAIGYIMDGGSGHFDGKIDDVRVYNRVLSTEEIQRLYQLGVTTKVGETVTSQATKDDLLLHYTFDGADLDWSSTTAEVRDVSGNDNHGDTSGTFSAATSLALGPVNQALVMVENDSVVSVGSPAELEDLTEFTLSAWVKHDEDLSVGTYPILVKVTGGCVSHWALSTVWGVPRGRIQFTRKFDGEGLTFSTIGAGAAKEGVWQHIAVSWNGTSTAADVALYIDGVLTPVTGTDGTGSPSDPGTGVTFIGDGYCATGVGGEVDDVRIYNRALTESEILDIYQKKESTRMAETITNPTLETGLVAHYTFDGQDVDWSSTTAEIKDRSGNANHGNATTTMSASKSPTMGVLGQAMSFDGSTDYIDSNGDSTLDNLTEFTYSAWIRPSELSYMCILGQNTNGGGRDEFAIDSSGYLYGIVSNVSGPTSGTSKSNTLMIVDEWSHVSMTFSLSGDKKSHLYINGTEVAYSEQDTPPEPLATNNPYDFFIGDCGWDQDASKWTGDLDDVRIYNRALSADEVRRLYQLGQ